MRDNRSGNSIVKSPDGVGSEALDKWDTERYDAMRRRETYLRVAQNSVRNQKTIDTRVAGGNFDAYTTDEGTKIVYGVTVMDLNSRSQAATVSFTVLPQEHQKVDLSAIEPSKVLCGIYRIEHYSGHEAKDPFKLTELTTDLDQTTQFPGMWIDTIYFEAMQQVGEKSNLM